MKKLLSILALSTLALTSPAQDNLENKVKEVIQTDKLKFNPTTESRYIAKKSFYEGIQDLKKIAKKRYLEEVYMYVIEEGT